MESVVFGWEPTLIATVSAPCSRTVAISATNKSVCHNPQPTTREIAIQVGITERAVQRILAKLISASVIEVRKEGCRNKYDLDLSQRLRHPLESHKTIGEFIHLIDHEYQAVE